MAQKKKVLKNKEDKNTKDIAEENEEEEVVGPKAKKSVDLESALEPANIIDDKADEEIPVITDDSEESSNEELSLDDDELNPFGDKWEQ
jgi:hypothetical protein